MCVCCRIWSSLIIPYNFFCSPWICLPWEVTSGPRPHSPRVCGHTLVYPLFTLLVHPSSVPCQNVTPYLYSLVTLSTPIPALGGAGQPTHLGAATPHQSPQHGTLLPTNHPSVPRENQTHFQQNPTHLYNIQSCRSGHRFMIYFQAYFLSSTLSLVTILYICYYHRLKDTVKTINL